MNGATIFFFFLAAVVIAAAAAMLLSRNAVYAAIFLVLNFTSIAVMYLTLFAPFIALVQITVYAGAIMVLVLFVIMLLGAEQLKVSGTIRWQRPLAIFLAVILVAEAAYGIAFRPQLNLPTAAPSPTFGSPTEIGLLLFNQYLIPFEITSVILLVAMVGVIVLTRFGRVRARRPAERRDVSGNRPVV